MVDLKYSSETAKRILEKFHQKGWNLYKSDNVSQLGAEETIKNKLAESLEPGSYVLLPFAENPKDPKQVFESLDRLSKKLGGNMPTIVVSGEEHPLTGLTLMENDVKIHTPYGIHVSYPVLMEALDSVVQTK